MVFNRPVCYLAICLVVVFGVGGCSSTTPGPDLSAEQQAVESQAKALFSGGDPAADRTVTFTGGAWVWKDCKAGKWEVYAHDAQAEGTVRTWAAPISGCLNVNRAEAVLVDVDASSKIVSVGGSTKTVDQLLKREAPTTTSEAKTDPIEVTPMSVDELQALFDDKGLEAFRRSSGDGKAGVAYSTTDAIIGPIEGQEKCGLQVDDISLIQGTITMQLSYRNPSFHPAVGDSAREEECVVRPDEGASFWHLTLREPLFNPGQSYPITLRAHGTTNNYTLVWSDPKPAS